ncbi:LysR family transcriptional regulator [Rouxiella badensis]|jgi:DNA-binding transcriptional LysR family regulator|uniref:LysR family transcriptional regulator n=1 Tax=Rouxiella badensis TaxID=1646377 RepID=UPI0013EF531A|nr:LysR family transcriptional regulator [Rouxiella badensis]MCC3704843.1 LysR family transcriptional regulator [Rouxiella badensis]MCC3735285.1 LysR family transcriptional regulator [Rouxiella badensis]MCC3760582.1 LysR family transcriptional regulator [Rouxiella badensis]QII38221.1 LysR family transcriptional regulator [Rouxiella badensis]QOI55682.1 LysR family transcriptional regulator [Rouxiella badensis subsp. acadiensis]
MASDDFTGIIAFITVAQERSFTRAAAKLGVSQSALSQTVRTLESRLGVRLLTRTTRSVSTTDAGTRLLETASPRLAEVQAEMAAIAEMRDKPSGTLRITASEHAADTLLWPRLARFLKEWPDIRVEVSVDYGMTDIAAESYDMGIRLGDEVASGMIAVRVGQDHRFAVIGSPDYLASHTPPKTPWDLEHHNCISFRLPTYGGLYAWEFKKGKQEVRVRVDGQLILNSLYQVINAALDGVGLAFVPRDSVAQHIADGRLQELIAEWCPTFPGYYLYYPSRRETSRAMKLLVEALRYRT